MKVTLKYIKQPNGRIQIDAFDERGIYLNSGFGDDETEAKKEIMHLLEEDEPYKEETITL